VKVAKICRRWRRRRAYRPDPKSDAEVQYFGSRSKSKHRFGIEIIEYERND
jgi:hypothetical protein